MSTFGSSQIAIESAPSNWPFHCWAYRCETVGFEVHAHYIDTSRPCFGVVPIYFVCWLWQQKRAEAVAELELEHSPLNLLCRSMNRLLGDNCSSTGNMNKIIKILNDAILSLKVNSHLNCTIMSLVCFITNNIRLIFDFLCIEFVFKNILLQLIQLLKQFINFGCSLRCFYLSFYSYTIDLEKYSFIWSILYKYVNPFADGKSKFGSK